MATFETYFPNLAPDEAADLKADLQSLGITERLYPMVRYVTEASRLTDIVYNNFEDGRNVLIFGGSGAGKTSIVRQCAKACGMRVEELNVSTRLPEDFAGVPLTLSRDLDDEEFRKFVADKLYDEKLAAAVDAEMEKHEEYANQRAVRRMLEHKLADSITVTEDEITDNLPRFANRKTRLEQRTSAPEWVWNIIDAYLKNRQRTVMFFDEINQGRPDTLNTLFQLILDKRFGNEEKYSFKNAVVFAAAGNFPRENDSVQSLSLPLMNRFDTIVIFRTDWSGSVDFIKSVYRPLRDEYPKLNEFLNSSSVTTEAWMNSFSAPRNIENYVDTLANYEEISQRDPKLLARVKSLELTGLPVGASPNIKRAVTRFLAEIGAPAFVGLGAGKTGAPSMGTRQNSHRSNLHSLWVQFSTGRPKEVNGVTYTKGINDKEFIEAAVKYCNHVTTDDLVAITNADGESIMDAYLRLGGTKRTLESFLL